MIDQRQKDISLWVYAAMHACEAAGIAFCDPTMHALGTLSLLAGGAPFAGQYDSCFPAPEKQWLYDLCQCAYVWGPFLGKVPVVNLVFIPGTNFKVIYASGAPFRENEYYRLAREQIESYLQKLDLKAPEKMAVTWACCSSLMKGEADLKQASKALLNTYNGDFARKARRLIPETLPKVGELFIDLLRQRGLEASADLVVQLLNAANNGSDDGEAPVFGLA